jgi:ferredoxin--NADP+ reductase
MNAPPRPIAAEIPLNVYRVSAPGVARVVSNERITPASHDEVRHIVLDLEGLDYRYLEGQSLGVLPPGADDRGRPNKLRLYSIASTRTGDDGRGRTASLCVKRVVYQDPTTGAPRRGVASNYLCDLEPGAEVRVTGPVGKSFLLPEDPATNLILVATGTGIAPFRAFLRRIYRELPSWEGAVFLFFGVRTAAEYLYRDELESFGDRPGYRLHTAFSREQATADGRRLYVQHRMAEQVEAIWDLLDRENTLLYVCGLKGMELGIAETLEARAAADGVDGKALLNALQKSGRLLVETY